MSSRPDIPRLGTRRTRLGRHSAPQQVYHIISATFGRAPVFGDFRCGRLVVSSIRAAEQRELARALAFVVMPDHVHWLMQLGKSQTLSEVVRWFKARSSLAVNQYRQRSDPVWQRGFFDRGVRREDDLVAVSRYIVANPLRAGLVKSIGDYPLWDAVWLS